MILELIKSAAFLLALSLLQGLVERFFWKRNPRLAQGISGAVFGMICVLGMMTPVHLMPGVIFDARSVILSMAGLFGGPVTGLTAAVIASGYRAWLAGTGAAVGIGVIVASTILGLLYRHANRKGWVRIDALTLLLFGLLVSLIQVGLFTALPPAAERQTLAKVALPLVLAFTPAIAILGLLLQDIERRLQIESDLRLSEERLSRHLENTPLAAVTWDRDFRCTQWNHAAEDIFGYRAEEAIGRHASELIIPGSLQSEISQIFNALVSGKGAGVNANENITKTGEIIFCNWYNTPIVASTGNVTGVASLAENITTLKSTTDELRFKNLLLTTQQEASADGILSVDADGKVISANRRFFDLWDLNVFEGRAQYEEPILETALTKVADPELFLSVVTYLYEHRSESRADEVTLRNGRILERHTAPMIGPDGQYYGRLWVFRDITARRESEALIWKQANFDAVTDLANRQLLYNRLEQAIKVAQRSNAHIALLYLDLDHFKDINDTLGHDVGDQLLKDAANRVLNCVRESDVVARQGGDEFIVMMTDLANTADVERVAICILKALAEPYRIAAETTYASTSIGITFYPDDAATAEALLRNADQAMYAAKARGRNCFHYYTKAMQDHALAHMRLVTDLRQAVPAKEQFYLLYQPIVDLKRGEVVKAEALLRWRHPDRGEVLPQEFIATAEETRLIIDLGEWVFAEAANRLIEWRKRLRPDLQISVNTSPVQYRSDRFSAARWIDYLKTVGLSGDAIVVEITEGLLMDTTSKVRQELLHFRDAGLQVSMDDFGTGYSSLSYLKQFDIDYIKIDQSFVSGLGLDSNDLALCEAIIVMAHKLGLKVIAEGVETCEQRDMLTRAGCDYGQGYYFSRPLLPERFETYVATQCQAANMPS